MKLLTIDEAASLLRVSVHFLYDHTNPKRDGGQPVPHRKLGSKTLFLENELLDWIEKGCGQSNTEKRRQ